MIIFAIGMIAILAMAGLALDGSHMLLNKTRLQNAVDAAALAAAVEMNTGGDINSSRVVAQQNLVDNASASGNAELATALGTYSVSTTANGNECGGIDSDGNDVNICIQFSDSYGAPGSGFAFAPGTWIPGVSQFGYVRVIVDGFTLPNYLIQVLNLVGFNPQKNIGASAISGPSSRLGENCGLSPLIFCIDLDVPHSETGELPAEDNDWNVDPGRLHVLKYANECTNTPPAGHGNFQLADVLGNGASAVAAGLAGALICGEIGGEVDTKEGLAASVSQGFNTRFNDFKGAFKKSEYTSDLITREPDGLLTYEDGGTNSDCSDDYISQNGAPVEYAADVEHDFPGDMTYAEYLDDTENGPYDVADGDKLRRRLPIFFADCSVDLGTGGAGHGDQTFRVLDFGCFYAMQKMDGSANGNEIFGEFVSTCLGEGSFGPVPDNGQGSYRIQLFHDFDRFDS